MMFRVARKVWVLVDPKERRYVPFIRVGDGFERVPFADIGICALNASAAVCSGICGKRFEPWDLELAIAWLLGVDAEELEAGKLEEYLERVPEHEF